VYALKQGQTEQSYNRNQPALIDPALIQAAGLIYHTYCEVHPEVTGNASGVAINRVNYRGKVIFIHHPALLPDECFVPLNQIESCVY
jgi:hypothetical protein